jgi:hypothetical protein
MHMYSNPRGKIVDPFGDPKPPIVRERGRSFTGFGCTLSIPRSSLARLVRRARLEHRTQESASIRQPRLPPRIRLQVHCL